MTTLTVELTAEDLARLEEGAAKFGSCSLVARTTEGAPVYVTVAASARKPGRPRGRRSAEPEDPPKIQSAIQSTVNGPAHDVRE